MLKGPIDVFPYGLFSNHSVHKMTFEYQLFFFVITFNNNFLFSDKNTLHNTKCKNGI